MTDLSTLAATMAAAVAANRVAMRKLDRIDRIRLLPLTDRLQRHLDHLTAELKRPLEGPYGTNGRWGENDRGPAIADWIAQSERIRAASVERVAA